MLLTIQENFLIGIFSPVQSVIGPQLLLGSTDLLIIHATGFVPSYFVNYPFRLDLFSWFLYWTQISVDFSFRTARGGLVVYGFKRIFDWFFLPPNL